MANPRVIRAITLGLWSLVTLICLGFGLLAGYLVVLFFSFPWWGGPSGGVRFWRDVAVLGIPVGMAVFLMLWFGIVQVRRAASRFDR